MEREIALFYLHFHFRHAMIALRHNSIILVTFEKVCVFTLVKMHALFSILFRVTGIVSQQSEPLHFSVRSFGCALFYCREV